MKRTTKQKRAALSHDNCQQYRKPNWDGCAANNYFAQRIKPAPGIGYLIKPKHAAFDRLRVIEIAENDMIFQIAHLAFEKAKIVACLEGVDAAKIQAPPDIEYSELYISTYRATARDILEKIRTAHYAFQRSRT